MNEASARESSARRSFLKTAGAAALPSNLFTGAVKGANDKVNVAFIGVGTMGSGNLGYAAKLPDVQITTVCDVYETNAEKAQAKARQGGFEAKIVKDFRDVLADKS